MKILYILNSLGKGGAERFVIDLCNELQRRHTIEYKLCVLEDKNEYRHITTSIPYTCLGGPYIPSMKRKVKFDSSRYKEIIDEFKPDIIHTNLFQSELYSSLNVNKKIIYVTHGHNNMVEYKNLSLKTLTRKISITNYFEKQLLYFRKYKNGANCYFIANSVDTFKYYTKNLPKSIRGNLKLIQYGFDFNRFANPNRVEEITQGKLKLINIGRFAIYKNQQLLVAIAKELRKRKIEFELNLLGAGAEMDKVQTLVDEAGLQNDVILRGNIDNVEDWLNDSHIYLHTAYYEPFGLVLLEAMASGLPCVILNGKGNADIIEHGENGYIFDEQNPVLFVDKIENLQRDSNLYSKLSKNAQAYASHFAIGTKTNELIEFYQSLLSK